MVRTYIRQTLALVAAIAVVLSFVGAPVAASALDAESDSGLGSLSSDSGSSEDTGDTDTGSDDTSNDDQKNTDDGSTNDTSDDGDDTADGSSDDGASDDGDDSTIEKDDGSSGDDSDDDRSLGSDGDADDSSENESDDRVRETVNGTADVVGNATDGLDDTAGGLEASTDGGDDGVVETADGLLDSVSAAALQLTALEFDNPFDADDDGVDRHTYDDSTGDRGDASPRVTDGGDGDAGGSDDAAAATAGGTGDGEQPDPADPAGAGAAIGLGAVATAAALRGSPVVAGSQAARTGGLLSTLLDTVRPFVFPLRYSRYDDSDPLEHEARERVYEIVNETPGSYLSEVSEEADLPLSTTRHHIKVLEREDLVSGAKLHGKRRFYPAYAEGIELAAALNDESTANIIDAIARIGAASVSDLADELGRDPSTISHHLQRLEEDGVITRERDGRAVVNKLSAEARTALEPEATPETGEAGAVAGGAD